MKNLSEVIKINENGYEVIKPTILLEKRNGDVIGKLNYTNLNMSISGTDPDEISFDVYKTVEPLFDSVIDLKICHVVGYGRFEISISKTCEETTVKSVNGISLETELVQSYLYEIHVNDDEYLERAANKDIYIEDFDVNENLIPIVFYNTSDPRHSLLHLLISEKASQWVYKYVTPNITEVNLGKKKSIASNKFQRTFTFDGTDILSAMSEVSKECNVIFSFDTENREISVYDRFTLGEDTTVLVNRRNFASSIQIDDLKDEVKNCFRVSGGDDIVTNYFSAVNITGNYIYDLNYQEEDMPTALSSAIHNYLDYKETLSEDYYGGYEVYDLLAGQPGLKAIPFYMGEKSTAPTPTQIGCYYYNTTTGKYYIWNGTEWLVAGAFVRYCAANDTLSYYQHVMAPTVGLVTTTAQAQAQAVKSALETITTDYKGVAVTVTVSSSDFAIATNNVLSYAKVIVDSRYTIKNIVEGTTVPSYSGSRWNGKLQFYRTSDETDNYTISVSVPIILADREHPEYQLQFAKQKIMKSLASNSTYDVDEYIVQITQGLDVDDSRFKQRIVTYLSEYNLTELKTFYDAFQSCLNVLDTYYNSGTAEQSALFETIYKSYKIRVEAADEVIKVRQKQVDVYEGYVTQYSQEIATMQKNADFKTYLDNISADLWTLFNSYRREDTYQNDNYISDGLNDGQILAKCKELLDAAQYNLSIACTLQHTLSVSINNLLIMPEFKEFWNKFAIFNYIRVQEDDLVEPYKLQLIQADFNFDSPDEISVTFATNISGSGNVLNGLESVVTQSISIGSSFSSVTQQATHGDSAKNQVSSWMNDGLNMAATQVKNADNEEVTVNNYGILLRSETDEGQYDPFQVKLTGQGLYYTGDSWNTVLGCLGKIYIDGEPASGLIAQNIIGELIAGQTLKISNSSGSVVIDGSKATFTDISINYEEGTGTNKKYVRIGEGHNIFKIGKGSTDQLYFDTTSNTLTLTGTVKASDIIGSTIKNSTNTFSIDSNGNIKGGSIDISSGSGSNERYFKVNTNGTMSVKLTNLTIGTDGTLKATNGEFTGKITATEGSFTGTISASTISGGSISGTSISGGSLSISNGQSGTNLRNFKVNTNGTIEVKQTNLTITSDGTITASSVSLNGTITTVNGNNKAELNSGKLVFSYNNTSIAEYTTTIWGGDTSKRGASINSPSGSKFISFNVPSSTVGVDWDSNLLINNGLNPDGVKEGIIAFQGMCVKKLTFKNSNGAYDPDQYFMNPTMYNNYWWGIHFDPGAYCIIGDNNKVATYSNNQPVELTVHGDICIHNDMGYWLMPSWGDFREAYIEITGGLSSNSWKSVTWTFDESMTEVPYVFATLAMQQMSGITVSVGNISEEGFTVYVASTTGYSISGSIFINCLAIVPRHF